jgi:MFS family permease
MTTATPPAAAPLAPRLFDRAHLPLAVGSVALVTLAAFENRAVGTALPAMVREFGAVSSFGVANAAPMATFLVALALTGLWADRHGPIAPLRLGIAAFALTQLIVGTAASMPAVIAGRLLGGLAEGLLDIALMVLVARVLPPALRPKMFSLFAAAWVLPSVLGPLVTGVVTEQAGWRWVFLGALGLLLPTWLLLRPAVRQVSARPPVEAPLDTSAARVAPWAVLAAASAFALTLAGERLSVDLSVASIAVVASAATLLLSVLHLVPRGTVSARRGLPAVVAVRGLTAASFGGAGAFLPLLLTVVHGFAPSRAGISLSVTGVMWAVGSWLQGRDHALPRPLVLRIGLGLITLGLLGTSLLAWASVPPAVGLTGWAVAGVGMGLASSSLSVLVLDLSTDHDQGRNNGAAQMAASTSMAVAFAAGGTLIALAAPDPGTPTFAAIILGAAAAALGGFLLSGRVTPEVASAGTDAATLPTGGDDRAAVTRREPATSSC